MVPLSLILLVEWVAVMFVVAATIPISSPVFVTTAYTFDPLNNMWKPSGVSAKTNQRRSSFATSNAPHHPSVIEAPPVFEEEVIRAQYSTWAGHYHNGVDKEHGESFQQKSLVQIEFNKRTGEVSLVDHDGIITKEDYQHLMRAISSGNNNNDAQTLMDAMKGTTTTMDVLSEDVTLRTTHFVDGEDIDPDQVIDIDASTSSSKDVPPATHACHTHNQVNIDTNAAPQQHAQYHHPHNHSPHQQQQQQQHHVESFHTFTIPQPPAEIQAQLQEKQYHQIRHIQQQQQSYQLDHPVMAYGQQQQQQQHHHTMRLQSPSAATAVVVEENPEVSPRSGGWGFNDRRSTFMN